MNNLNRFVLRFTLCFLALSSFFVLEARPEKTQRKFLRLAASGVLGVAGCGLACLLVNKIRDRETPVAPSNNPQPEVSRDRVDPVVPDENSKGKVDSFALSFEGVKAFEREAYRRVHEKDIFEGKWIVGKEFFKDYVDTIKCSNERAVVEALLASAAFWSSIHGDMSVVRLVSVPEGFCGMSLFRAQKGPYYQKSEQHLAKVARANYINEDCRGFAEFCRDNQANLDGHFDDSYELYSSFVEKKDKCKTIQSYLKDQDVLYLIRD